MTQLIIAGLLLLCLSCAGIIWYLVLKLNATREHVRRIELESNELRRRSSQDDASQETTHDASQIPEASVEGEGVELSIADEASTEDAPRREETTSTRDWTQAADALMPPIDELSVNVPDEAAGQDVYALAWSLSDFYDRSTSPKELLLNERFSEGVEMLRTGAHTEYDLLGYAQGSNVVVGCMALEALARRATSQETADMLVGTLNDLAHWPRHYALRAVRAHAMRPMVAEVLTQLDSTWRVFVSLQSLREFVGLRVSGGEVVTYEDLLGYITRCNLGEEQIENLKNLVADLGSLLPSGISEELGKLRSESVDLVFLKSFGRVWEADDKAAEVVLLETIKGRVAELESAIKREPARSVMLVGDSGTGKTALVRAVAARLRGERWTILEASAGDVLAGQQYIGQLEERVQAIVRQIGGKRVLWVMPNFQDALWAGRHKYSPTGVLDLLLPYIESGHVKLIGEVPSASFEGLMRLRPRLRTVMQTCRVAPLSDEETLVLGRRWAERHAVTSDSRPNSAPETNAPRVSEGTLREALHLARQYIGDKAAPGNLIVLLEATARRLDAESDNTADAITRQITLDDVLVTLSQLTGLPAQILDEREGLDLGELRAFFERRVLGQPEAVDCLVERVAMIKAGLTDPTRPQGVFLFVGPTGTGKTEIAKTLAEFLFGSPERMIRLDMSELQTAESLNRILGEWGEAGEGAASNGGSVALVNSIRKQPFSVVLLDEFEKAHPQVWDLFLQVFDDGRLTDRTGNTADFRHCVVLMTSNLGATLPAGAGIGFSREQAEFASGGVERAVAKTFLREFVNRIDRVVVFRPLGLAVMRDLLRKELNDVLGRRGFRTRQWAVEWDESAIEFLLHKGFTADLGARPLKRAIERYLLSPLSLTIVNHQFPEGDQFLFVRSSPDNSALAVQFVDPDATEGKTNVLPPLDTDAEELLPSSPERELRLESIALDAHGDADEVRLLRDKFDELSAQIDDEAWRGRKTDALQQTQGEGFWDSPARFIVLGLAEYMDRIETGLDTAGSLLRRLAGASPRDRTSFPPDLVARIAEQLYLLEHAAHALATNEPRDAFVLVHAVRETGADNSLGDEFARRIAGMYRGWAKKRRMRLAVLEEYGGATSVDEKEARRDGASGGDNARREHGDARRDGGDARRDESDAKPVGSPSSYRALLAVSGFGAYSILQREAGLHILETPQDEKSFNRARVQVRVVAQPDEPPTGHGQEALRRQAEDALAFDEQKGVPPSIVRRYREEPSPLVRDSVRGWRTGKLERVLGGDFDLIT
ncbi:MAG: AAA family ATPase [Pyrinomonadaceae bacterium]